MTISSTVRSAGPFVGNGITTDFPFSYKVFSRADVLVAQTVVASGVETIKTLDADYTVILNANQKNNPGGVIRMFVAPPAGTYLSATSNIALVQALDLTNQGGFYPEVINDALDRIVINIQQLAGKIGHGLGIGQSAFTDQALSAIALITDIAKSTGSGMVGFIQNGYRSVKRSVQDKLRDMVSVKDFGAKGDGVTDDTEALQAAIDSGYNLWFPAGVYLHSANLNISDGIIIRGEYRKSVLKRISTGTVTPISRTYYDNNNVLQTKNYNVAAVFNLLFPNNSYLVDVIIDGLAFDLPEDGSVGVFNAMRVAISSFRNLHVNRSAFVVKGFDIWQVEWSNIRSQFSKDHFNIDTGTSNVFSRVYCNTKFNTGGNGFTFVNLDYTAMVGCAADSLDRAYYFSGSHCRVEMSGCGSETFSRVLHATNQAKVNISGGSLWLFKSPSTAGSTFYPYQIDGGASVTMSGTHLGVFDNAIAGATLSAFTVTGGAEVVLNHVRYPVEIGGGTATTWWYVADTATLVLNDKNGARYITARGPSRFDAVSNLKSFEYTKTIAAGAAQSIFRIGATAAGNAYGDNFNAKVTVHMNNGYVGDMGFNGIVEFHITGFKEATTSQNLTPIGGSYSVSNTGSAGFGGVTGALVRNGDNTVDFQLNVANAPQTVGNTNVTVFVQYMTFSGTTPSSNIITGV